MSGAVICALLLSNVLLPALGIRDETASGIYSVCFQQSARVLRDEQVTEEEYAALMALPEEERGAAFTALWTVKEAAFKMEGKEEFFPARVSSALPHRTDEWEGCIWTVTTPHPDRVRVYHVTEDKLSRE